MNPNMNMMPMGQHQMAQSPMQQSQMQGPSLMQVSPMMQAANPNQMQQQQQLQMHQQQQQQQQQQHQQQADKLDNIMKVKSLSPALRESVLNTLQNAAAALMQNHMTDNLKRDGVSSVRRFEKHMEEFYAICDQIVLNLKTAATCLAQVNSANRYLQGPAANMRGDSYMPQENPMSYQTLVNTARIHVQSAKDIHDTLISAAQNISQAD